MSVLIIFSIKLQDQRRAGNKLCIVVVFNSLLRVQKDILEKLYMLILYTYPPAAEL